MAERIFTTFSSNLLIKLWYVPQFELGGENTRLVFPKNAFAGAKRAANFHSQPQYPKRPIACLDKCKIELGLMYRFVRCDIDMAEVGLDLFEDLAFGAAKRLGDVRVDAQCRMTDVIDAA